METIHVDKKFIVDLAKQISELNDKMETLEILSNRKIMNSLKKSKQQIKKRDFANWNDLQNYSD